MGELKLKTAQEIVLKREQVQFGYAFLYCLVENAITLFATFFAVSEPASRLKVDKRNEVMQ